MLGAGKAVCLMHEAVSRGQVRACEGHVNTCMQVLPEAPAELVRELSRRYVLLYEKITGEAFQVPDLALHPAARIAANVAAALEQLQ